MKREADNLKKIVTDLEKTELNKRMENSIREQFHGAPLELCKKQFKKMIASAKKELAKFKKTEKDCQYWIDSLEKKEQAFNDLADLLSGKKKPGNSSLSKMGYIQYLYSDIVNTHYDHISFSGNSEKERSAKEKKAPNLMQVNNIISSVKDIMKKDSHQHFWGNGGLSVEDEVKRELWLEKIEDYIRRDPFGTCNGDLIQPIFNRISRLAKAVYKGDLILPGLDPEEYRESGDVYLLANEILKVGSVYNFMTPEERQEKLFLGVDDNCLGRNGKELERNLYIHPQDQDIEQCELYRSYLRENAQELEAKGITGFYEKDNNGDFVLDKNGGKIIKDRPFLWDMSLRECRYLCNALPKGNPKHSEKDAEYKKVFAPLVTVGRPQIGFFRANFETSDYCELLLKAYDRTMKKDLTWDTRHGSDDTLFFDTEFLRYIDLNMSKYAFDSSKKEELEKGNKDFSDRSVNAHMAAIGDLNKRIQAHTIESQEMDKRFQHLFAMAKTVDKDCTAETTLEVLMTDMADNKDLAAAKRNIKNLNDEATRGFFSKFFGWYKNDSADRLNDALNDLNKRGGKITEYELRELAETAVEVKRSIERSSKFAKGNDLTLDQKIARLDKIDKSRYKLAMQVLEGVDANLKAKINKDKQQRSMSSTF